jgi:proline dehydrogenase
MENATTQISFDNTEFAFQHKTNQELKKAHFLFKIMSYQWLVKIGSRITPWAIKVGLPIKGIIRNTIFSQFVGGETMEQTTAVAKKLNEFNVKVILDYGVEGKEGEENFDNACNVFVRVINYAATQPNIPFMSVKVTGFARFALLEKLNAIMNEQPGGILQRYENMLAKLDTATKQEWEKVAGRVERVCAEAASKKIGVSIDAEETWIQEPLDALTTVLMEKYNKDFPVVYNTLQHYRTDRVDFLKACFEIAKEKNFILGMKLVRGAYMEKERKRAIEKGYASPIHTTKDGTDNDYNAAVNFCIQHVEQIALVVASHNEYSNLLAARLLQQKGLPLNHPHVHWSQLYGMSDNISFNLAHAGASVSKYLPFGPIADVIPYLMRRAQENTSVKGQTGRELKLIQKELARRQLSV